jgi:hypothetical protein
MKFTLTINCDNAAFKADEQDDDQDHDIPTKVEIVRILRGLADEIEMLVPLPRKLRDLNGNKVGEARFEEG